MQDDERPPKEPTEKEEPEGTRRGGGDDDEVAKFDASTQQEDGDQLNSSAEWMERMIPTAAAPPSVVAVPTTKDDSKQQHGVEQRDRAYKNMQSSPSKSAADRRPGAEAVAIPGAGSTWLLPRFKDQVNDAARQPSSSSTFPAFSSTTTSTPAAAAATLKNDVTPRKNKDRLQQLPSGAEAVAGTAMIADGGTAGLLLLPRFKDQVNDHHRGDAAAAAGPSSASFPPNAASLTVTTTNTTEVLLMNESSTMVRPGGAETPDGGEMIRPPSFKGTDTSSPSARPPTRGPDVFPGAVAVPRGGPRFKDQVQSVRRSNDDAAHLAAAALGGDDDNDDASPADSLAPGAVAVQKGSGPRFKDQMQSARCSEEDAANVAAALDIDDDDDASADIVPGAVAVQKGSGPRFKDQMQSARRSEEDAADGAATLGDEDAATSVAADTSHDGSDVRSARLDEKDGENDFNIVAAIAATSAGAVAASASTWQGPQYKHQVNISSRRDADAGNRTQSSSSDSGPRFIDQVQDDTAAPGPIETRVGEESKDCVVEDDEEQQQGLLTENNDREEQERSAMLLHAEVVEDENDVRDRILKDAVQAEVVDESKAKRRRILCGVLLVCLVAATVGGAVAGTLGRDPPPLPASPTMAPTIAPSFSPSGILRNDICEDATRVKVNGGTQLLFDDLGSATPDSDVIQCLEDDPSPIQGRWYTFRGNGLAMTINLCTSSGQIRTPLILTGRCGELSCINDFGTNFRTNVTSSCVILEQVFFTSEDTQYWIYVYSNTDLIDEASYRLSVSSNDVCLSALGIDPSGGRARLRGSTEFATTDAAASCTASPSVVARGVWFRWQGSGTLVELDTCDNNAFATELTVYKGDCDNLECVSTEYGKCGDQSRAVWFAEEGEIYHVLLHGSSQGSKGPFTLTATATKAYTRCEFADVLDVTIQSYTGSSLDAEFPSGPIAGACGSGVGVWYSFVGTGSAVSPRLVLYAVNVQIIVTN